MPNRTRSETWNTLKQGQSAAFEGMTLVPAEGQIRPGDTYVAERNTGLQLLTCKRVISDKNFIIPTENAYCFDIWECIPVEICLEKE